MNDLNKIPILTLRKEIHRKKVVLSVYFEKNFSVKEIVKNIEGFQFSATKKAWVAPFSETLISKLKNKLNEFVVFIDDASLRKNISITQRTKRNISEQNKDIIRAYVKYLQGKRLSENTVKVYFGFVADFVDYIKDKALNDLTNRDVELFIEDIFLARNISVSTQRQFISAMKHFAVFYPECSINELELTRPKKNNFLPTVLSQEEVLDLIRACKNLKHRAIITLLYSSGLRIGELMNLQLKHISIDRMQIYIENGKGRKDRYVQLAKSFIPLLRNYFMTYKPSKYFVENPNGSHYSASSVRKFLHRATKEAGIHKKVTPHTLRHSYATHMLENGIGLRHIQALLGHSKPETTMIYTHVAKKDLLDIESPLDNIILALQKSDKEEQNFLLSRNKKQ